MVQTDDLHAWRRRACRLHGAVGHALCPNAYAAVYRRHYALRPLERAEARSDGNLGPARCERLRSEDESRDCEERRDAPYVVEVEVRLDARIPRLHRRSRALAHHAEPAAVAVGCHVADHGVFTAVFGKGLEKVPGVVDAARHPAGRAEVRDRAPALRRHEAERQCNRVCVERRVRNALSVHVKSCARIQERLLVRRQHARCARGEIICLAWPVHRLGDVRHAEKGLVVVGVHHGVHGGEAESVAFARRPVHDVAASRDGALAALAACKQEAVRLSGEPRHQPFVAQRLVVALQEVGIAATHPVLPSHDDHRDAPLGRPCWVLHQVFKRRRCRSRVCECGVGAGLRDERVALVRQALAVTVNEKAERRSRGDCALAEVPHLDEPAVGAVERRLFHVVAVFDGDLAHVRGGNFIRRGHDLRIPERHDRADIGRQRKSAAVAAGRDGCAMRRAASGDPALQPFDPCRRAVWLPDASLRVHKFAQHDFEAARRSRRRQELEPAERLAAEVDERVSRGVAAHFRRCDLAERERLLQTRRRHAVSQQVAPVVAPDRAFHGEVGGYAAILRLHVAPRWRRVLDIAASPMEGGWLRVEGVRARDAVASAKQKVRCAAECLPGVVRAKQRVCCAGAHALARLRRAGHDETVAPVAVEAVFRRDPRRRLRAAA